MPSSSIPPGSELLRVQTLLEQAEFWASQKQTERARRLFLKAISLDHGLKSRWEYAVFLSQIGEERSAIEQLTIIWNAAKRQKQPQWARAACENLAVIHRKQGQWAVAWSFQQQAISARVRSQAPRTEDDFSISELLATANDAISRGDLAFAEQLVNCALVGSEDQNCPGETADAWGTNGAIFLLKRQLPSAWRCFLKAYALHSRAKDLEGVLLDLLNLAAVSREKGRWELARRLLLKAGAFAKMLNDSRLLRKAARLLQEAQRVLAVASRVPEWN